MRRHCEALGRDQLTYSKSGKLAKGAVFHIVWHLCQNGKHVSTQNLWVTIFAPTPWSPCGTRYVLWQRVIRTRALTRGWGNYKHLVRNQVPRVVRPVLLFCAIAL